MRQLWFGMGILILLLGIGIYAGIATENVCTPVSQLLEQAGNLAVREDPETAAILVHSAHQKWQKHWNRIALLADHSPMDEIDGLFAQTAAYSRSGAYSDFSANCHRLAALVDAVAEAHQLTWWNII